jgi:hypothetical protein
MRRILCMAVVVVGMGAGACEPDPPPPATPTVTATSTVPPEFATAVEWRKAKGLPYDLDHIRKVEADPNTVQWPGFKLTFEESRALEMSEGAASADIGPLAEAVAESPVFAGIWVEQPAGKPVIATTGVAAMKAFLAAFPNIDVTIVPARYTDRELRALQDQVVQDAQSGALGDVRMASVGVDVMQNVVRFGVTDLTYEQRLRILARYGPRVVVEEEGPFTFGTGQSDLLDTQVAEAKALALSSPELRQLNGNSSPPDVIVVTPWKALDDRLIGASVTFRLPQPFAGTVTLPVVNYSIPTDSYTTETQTFQIESMSTVIVRVDLEAGRVAGFSPEPDTVFVPGAQPAETAVPTQAR